ncbi:gamma-glutamyltransferase [Acidobacteria bacterium AH-259-O06]|nr:gamma-glutamyltransferase [Acidobacteria bacterium AH-259-O06]
MKFYLAICLLFLVSPLLAADRVTGRQFASRSEVIAQNGMAATSHPLATQIAMDILQDGGNAVDAAIAANAALGLMEPTGCGIGGDLFAIVWIDREQKLYGLNASGRSPYALTLQEFKKRSLGEIPRVGPLPVSVPGCVDGWFELHKKFGKLPIKKVLEPAIRYARRGFPLTQVISHSWSGGSTTLKDQPNFASTFMPGGKAPSEGGIFRNPDLANTLEKIAQGGRDVFYKGEIARSIDEFCKRVGCFLRYRDLAEHTSTWVEPVSTNYRGYDVWELPPNGQGIAVLQMLNILEAFDLRSMGHNSADYLHHLVEVKKIAFEDRAKFYADPDFNRIPMAELISKQYAEKRRKLLNPERASDQIPAGDPKLARGDTIYLTVADREHNMISLIQSNFIGFGSGLVPDSLGFVLQNRGALFNLEEGHFNTYAPHKRPFHTIIPAFVTRAGKPFLSFGVMGGDMQPQGHVQILCNIIDFEMNLQEAGDAPRFYHLGSSSPTGSVMSDGGELALESGIAIEALESLVEKGHRLRFVVGLFGGYQAILYDANNKVYRGASESRKDGMAAGY